MIEDIPCLILARGGSVRLPRKNVRPFCGKPLIVWSIEAALQIIKRENVYLSTDDDEIAQVASDAGATVIRRDWVSTADESGSIPTWRGIQKIDPDGQYERFLSILPTGPCVLPGDFKRMISLSRKGGYKVVSLGYCPRETILLARADEDKGVMAIFERSYKYWSWIGSSGVSDRKRFDQEMAIPEDKAEHNKPIPTLWGLVPIHLWQCQDVDTEEEWEVGEYWFQKKILDVYGKNPYERND